MKNQLNRRQALKASVALAAPLIIPAHVLGRGAVPPSEKINVGIIGCGKMANDYHISSLLKADDCRVVAVAEVDKTRREHAQKRVNDKYKDNSCAAYSDFREITKRDDIDAVCIATPDHWHTIPIIEACKSGKDVYCEKPLTLTLAESKACIDVVRKYKRVFQTAVSSVPMCSVSFARQLRLSKADVLVKFVVSLWVLGIQAFPVTCLRKTWNRVWTGTCGWGRLHCASTTPFSVRAEFIITFRSGESTVSIPAAVTPTWARTITTSRSGLWGWISRDR